MTETGLILNIQRFSTEDGPGLRTTVFLKGCPLRCAWCQNPEGLSPQPELVWMRSKCQGHGRCVAACAKGALLPRPDGLFIDRSKCDACGACAVACPTAALEVLGRRVASDALAAELARDAEFFAASGGGVTFSGGECLTQPEFVFETAAILRADGIKVAFDTAGLVSPEIFGRALEAADLILYDVKLIDRDRHQAACGADNRLILENARSLGRSGKPFWVRFPVIPGYTDDDENVRDVSRFVAREMAGAERVDFLAYNNLCEGDWTRLGLPYALAGRPLLTRERFERVLEVGREAGIRPIPSGPVAA